MDVTKAAVFLTFISCLFMVYIFWWGRRRCFELGAKLPGPPGIPILGNALCFASNNLCQCFQETIKLLRTYGPIVRLWFGPVLLVILSDAHYVQEVVNHDKIGTRGRFGRKVLDPIFGKGLLSIDIESWRLHRKIISSALHINTLEKFVENFAKNSNILADKLSNLADGTTAHNILPFLNRCTLDIISETCFSYEMKAQVNNDNESLNNIRTIIHTTTFRLIYPWYTSDYIFKMSDLSRKYYAAVNYFHRIINNVIEQKRLRRQVTEDLNDQKPTLIDLLVQNGVLSKEEIVGEISSIGGAGTETTANACCYVLALLAENHDIQGKVVQEQQTIFGDDFLRPVRSEDLSNMTYLEQVLNEAMRLFPPVPSHYREAVTEIDLGNGHIIPAGTTIMIVAYDIHRNSKYFPDPDRFDPDRFSPQNSAGRHPYAYMPFGIGRRFCVGHRFAIMEAKTILSTVLRRFYITELEDGIKCLENSLQMGFVFGGFKWYSSKILTLDIIILNKSGSTLCIIVSF